MRISEASRHLGTTARMLRYRESLGLLPRLRGAARRPPGVPAAPRQRRFGPADLDAAALGLSIEHRYDISPAALAFGVLVLADPRVRAEVAELGRRIGRIAPPPARALDFEQERALRLLSLSGERPPWGQPSGGPSPGRPPPAGRRPARPAPGYD